MQLTSTPHLNLFETWRWFAPLGLVAWGTLIATLPRTRAALAITTLSVATHVVFFAPRIAMHDLSAYHDILSAYGMTSPDLLYGEGRTALLMWPLWLLRWPMDGTHWVHATLAALTAPHLYALMRSLYDEHTARLAAVFYALAPLPLALAPTETSFVPLVTMEVLAIHGLVRGGVAGDLMLVIGAGMVTHLRPLEGLIGAALTLVAWSLGRRRAAVGVALFVGWKLVNWWSMPPTGGGLQLAAYWRTWDSILLELVGRSGRAMIFDPTRTPVVLSLLALVGAANGWRMHPRRTAGLIALCAFATLAYVNQGFLADRIRYQLPAQVWLCALAGIGAAAALRWRRGGRITLVALCVSWWFARQPYPPFQWQAEYTALRSALATLPAGTRVAFDAHLDEQFVERVWARLFAGVELVPLEDAAPDVAWRWVGLADHQHAVQQPLADAVFEVTVVPVPLPADPVNNTLWGCAPCTDQPMTVGLYRRSH